ncbi:glycosyltransferase [Myroides sp.]|uniref:glycosyltransferase n=1 Tax=Myroides sp. TaxID=1874736 RepID=UPI0028B21111|nr:glycosyltransferase [Myroides sp.]
MKVVVLLEAGIPSYRNFLFEALSKVDFITDFKVVHSKRIYNGKKGSYKNLEVPFIGSNKLGVHLGGFRDFVEADVIIASYNLRILTCWMGVFFKKKFVFWGKGLGSNESCLINALRKLTSSQASKILVYNDFKKEELLTILNIKDRNKVIAYNNTVEVINNEDLSTYKKDCFLYFGRIQERKGLKEMILNYNKYIQLCKEEFAEPYKLCIVGDGDYKTELIDCVDTLGINEYIEFYPGVYNDEEIKHYFKRAICYLSPYNVGLGVINSFAYGVPVVTCRLKQVGPEFNYLTKENSIVFDNIDELASILYRMTKEKYIYNCYSYFLKNLKSSVMVNNFVNVLKDLK